MNNYDEKYALVCTIVVDRFFCDENLVSLADIIIIIYLHINFNSADYGSLVACCDIHWLHSVCCGDV